MPDASHSTISSHSSACGLVVGTFVGVEAGELLVDFPGNLLGPVAARTTLTQRPQPGALDDREVPVLLAFAANDPATPVLIGFLSDTVPTATAEAPCRQLSLTASEEVEIRCGEFSIVLKANGTLVVKARTISSRARESHKIKGASVDIN